MRFLSHYTVSNGRIFHLHVLTVDPVTGNLALTPFDGEQAGTWFVPGVLLYCSGSVGPEKILQLSDEIRRLRCHDTGSLAEALLPRWSALANNIPCCTPLAFYSATVPFAALMRLNILTASRTLRR